MAALLVGSCSTYRDIRPPDLDHVEFSPGDEIRVLTKDGERFHGTVASLEAGGVLNVANKEYGYQEGTTDAGHRERVRYAVSDLASLQVVAGWHPKRMSPRTRAIILGVGLALMALVPLVVYE